MKHYNVEQNSEAWDLLRLGKFTASTFGDLFMKPETATYRNAIIKVAYERVTGESEESYSNKWMQRGHEKEPFAAEAYESLTFRDLEPCGFYEYNDFVGASPDRKIKDENAGCEFKCPSFQIYNEFIESDGTKLPKSYYWQIHGQLLCTEWDYIDYFPFSHTKLRMIPLRIYRDEEILSMLTKQLEIAINEVELLIKKIRA